MLVLWPEKLNQIDCFAKVVFYMHEEDQDQLKGAKTWNSSQKSSFCQAYLPFSQFVLKRCSNKSGQNDLGLKCCSLSQIQFFARNIQLFSMFYFCTIWDLQIQNSMMT